MASGKAYWAERATLREREAYLRGGALVKRLMEEYQQSARELRWELEAFYGKYAGKYGLTYEEAVRRLSLREFREWKAGLGEYLRRIEAAGDPRARADLEALLDGLSANSQISRLEALLADARAQLDVLYSQARGGLETGLGDGYAASYYRKHFDLQRRAGYMASIAALTPELIADAVSYPWSGAMFSDRLWRNKEALLFHLRETVTQGMIQGKSLPEVSKAMADKLGQSYKAAERLVRTETSHLHALADLEAYRAAGVEEYEFMASLNERTCEVCGGLDGRHFRLAEARPGENYPPLHPNCRCTTVEYDPEEAAAGERMPETMTYGEWREKQGIHQSADGSEGKRGEIERVGRIDPSPERIDALLMDHERKWVGMDHEEAVIVAADGEVFHTMGDEVSVDSSALGERLRGAVDFHNHPDDKTYYSFSDKDVGYFLQMGQRECRAADSVYRYVMRRTDQTVDALSVEVEAEFRKIREGAVRELAWNGEIDIDIDEYHETVLRLSKKYHFEYERVERDAGG